MSLDRLARNRETEPGSVRSTLHVGMKTDLERSRPNALTTVYGKAARTGKILIDYKRNHRAAVSVAAFSTGARPSASVSVPVSWSELGRIARPDPWNVLNLRARLAKLKVDPWREYWSCRQSIGDATLSRTLT